MRNHYPYGRASGSCSLPHSQRGSSQVLVMAAIALLTIIGVGLITLTALSIVWKVLVLIVLIGAAAVAWGQVSQLIKSDSDSQSALSKARGMQELAQTYQPLLENYQHLLKEILPLWQRQTELARSQLENSINELVGRFSEIHHRLQAAVASSSTTANSMKGDNGLGGVIHFANDELSQITQTLSLIHI